MEIPPNILSELICDRCETYLKRSPVYRKHDGTTVCSSCLDPKDRSQASPMRKYELLAQLMKFPCKYEEFGCPEKMIFGSEAAHESACSYKQYLCPVAKSGKCEWLGQRSLFLQHCEEAHLDQVIKNPCTLTHDIKKANLRTFLLNAYLNVLFLVHTKVCITSGKIYHSVRFLGDPNKVSTYSYTLKVKRHGLEICKPGQVAPEGCLALQEDSSLSLNINSLLDVLDGFDNTIFSLTIKTACKNQSKGCTYVDLPVKCAKHEMYFCEYRTKCAICKEFTGILLLHYQNEHKNYLYNGESFWELNGYECVLKDEVISSKICLISSEAGTVICDIWNNNKDDDEGTFGFKLYSPIIGERLNDYSCKVYLTIRGSIIKHIYTLTVRHDSIEDWYISFKTCEFPTWNEKCKVNIKICRI